MSEVENEEIDHPILDAIGTIAVLASLFTLQLYLIPGIYFWWWILGKIADKRAGRQVAKAAAAGLAVGIGSVTGGLREQSRKKDAAARRAYKRKWNKPMGGKPVRTPKPKPPKKPRTPNQARGDRKRSATMKKRNMNKKVKF